MKYTIFKENKYHNKKFCRGKLKKVGGYKWEYASMK